MFYRMSLKKKEKNLEKLRNCVVLSMCNAWNILLKKIILFSMGVFSLKKKPQQHQQLHPLQLCKDIA